MTWKFDPYFNDIFGVVERGRMHDEEQRAVLVDRARAEAALRMLGVDRTRLLAAVAASARATFHETGAVDWRAAVAYLVSDGGREIAISAKALEELVLRQAAGDTTTNPDKESN